MNSNLTTKSKMEFPTRWKSGDKIRHFTIIKFIASEPLGDNYLAKDSQLDRTVAIKRFAFNVDMEYTEEMVANLKKKFLEDVTIFSKWDHPNLVSIHFFDNDDMGIPFYAMEYVPETLGQWIGLIDENTEEALEAQSEVLSLEKSIEIVLGICRGLEIMHNEGICHYRISPNNILITPEGIPKLVSFGIETGMRIELASKIQQKFIGIYSAPEQVRGDHEFIGRQSDIYTIGLIFFQLMSGKLPTGIFDKDTCLSYGIQNAVHELLLHILSEKPNDRPELVGELIDQLQVLKSPKKTGITIPRYYTIPMVIVLIFSGIFYGIYLNLSVTEKEIQAHSNFTPMIPSSIYENLDPLGQYIFWTDLVNNSTNQIQIELLTKFKGISNDWNKVSFFLEGKSDTTVGLNPFMNILQERPHLRTNRNYYIDWKVMQKRSRITDGENQTLMISEGSHRIVMLGLGSIDWEILKHVYSTTKDDFSPYSLIASWIIPKDTRDIISMTNHTYNSSVVGYQKSLFESYTGINGMDYRDIIRFQIERLFNTVKSEFNIVYDGGGIGQTINFPRETLEYKSANCIELSVLFSSILLESGIEPVIVIIPGHAFIGWQIWDDVHQYDFLETTIIGDKDKSFEDALFEGNKIANEFGLKDMITGKFNSRSYNRRGIFQKSPRVEVFHISSLRNFKDAKGRQVYTSVPVGFEVN